PRGQFGKFTGAEARELGFAKLKVENREAVTQALELPPGALLEDPSLGGNWRTLLVRIDGPIEARLVERIKRTISEQIKVGVNFVCLEITSAGGSPHDSGELANFLADLKPGDVRAVAFIPSEARADAALVALACDQLVMAERAMLGGVNKRQTLPPEIGTVIQHIAEQKSRSWSLMAALVDPSVEIHRYTRKGQQHRASEYFSPEELDQKRGQHDWEKHETIKRKNESFSVDGRRAKELGLATHLASNQEALEQLYRLGDELSEVRPNWALELIEALAQPSLAWLLLLIGFGAMYIEMQTPGVGVGGFVSGICFLLYFWSQFLHGTAEWLEALLFVAGVVCVMIELFVVPGFTVFGLGGVAMILTALVLATQTSTIPQNEYQLQEFRTGVLVVVGGLGGCVLLAVALRRYLPHTPLFGQVILQPPAGEELDELRHRESLADLSFLTGRRGITTTRLAPGGTARFDGELIHVLADGELIPAGVDVVVVEARGTHVVVRTADAAADDEFTS
ncbi:MAG: NfeD family protein, partial [Pirellulales bacterium]